MAAGRAKRSSMKARGGTAARAAKKTPTKKAPAKGRAAKASSKRASIVAKAPAASIKKTTAPIARAPGNGARSSANGADKQRPKTKRAVIAISRTLGSGADEIGRAVAQTIGYRYTDDEIIVRAAQRAGVTPDAIEEVERKPSLMQRILKAMARIPLEPGMGAGATTMLAPRQAETQDYERLIEQVIRETAEEGSVVIFAHGASIALGPRRDVLRVLVTASPEVRVRRIARQDGVTGEQAVKSVEESDIQRKSYLSRLYKVRAERPTHYDLVLNTDLLTARQAASIIVDAAGA